MPSSSLVDLVKVVTSTVGTGSSLAFGAAVPSFRSGAVLTDGATYSYAIQQGSDWEYGRGVWTAGTSRLTRVPIRSSNSDTPIALLAGAEVALVLLAEDIDDRVGIPANITVGTVTSGATPGVTISGTSPNFTLDFVIPDGDVGPPNVLTVGTVTKIAAGGTPTVGITGTSPSQTINFGLVTGDTGSAGATGGSGPAGPANTIAIGTVTKLAPGSTPVASVTGTPPNQTLNLSVVTGDTGAPGIPDPTASAASGVYPNAAAANVPRGAALNVLTPGTGGTNGTNYTATYTGGNYTGNPTILYDVVAGAVTNVRLVDPGLYIGASPTAPTVVLGSGAGGAALTLTNVFRVGTGSAYWVQSTDLRQLDRYVNTAGAAVRDATVSSILTKTGLAPALPLNSAGLKAFRQQPGTFNTAGSTGGGYTKTSGQTTFATYNINVEDTIARAAGQLFTLKIPVLQGSVTAAFVTQKNGATTISGPTAMPIDPDGFPISRNVLIDPDATILFFTSVTAGASGVTVDDVGVSYGEPAVVRTENELLRESGAIEDAANSVAFLRPSFYSYVLLAGSTPTFNSVDGLVCPLTTQAQFVLAFPFETDGLYTLRFMSPNMPNTASVQAFLDKGFAHSVGAFTAAPLPRLRKLGNYYEVSFYANLQGTDTVIGIAIRIDNVSPLTDTVLAGDFRLVKGGTLPLNAKTPVRVLDDTARATRNYMIVGANRTANPDRTKISVQGTSISAGYNGPGGAASSWPAQLQILLTAASKAVTVTNNAVRGSFSTGQMARWNSTPAYVTVTGGAIPATVTPVQISFDPTVDFFSQFTATDGSEPLTGYLAGVFGTFSRVTTTYYFTRAVAAAVDTPATGSQIVTTVQGQTARNNIRMIEPGRNDEFTPNFISRPALPDWLMGYVDRDLNYSLPAMKYEVVVPPIIGLQDPDIALRQATDVRYKAMLAAYGLPILDFNRAMTAVERTYLSGTLAYTMTTQDSTDDANGLLFTGARQADGLHQNLLGNKLLGYRAFNLLVSEAFYV